jgi:hypothetical protein
MTGGNLWTLPIGDDGTYTVTIYGASNRPIAYTGSGPLAVRCWQRDNLANVSRLVTGS